MNRWNSTTQSQPPPQHQNLALYNERAWKYIGYPGFCDFSALDDDFLLLRRFAALNIRVLLDLQFQITQVEAQLLNLDQECRDDPDQDSAASRMDSLAWDNSEHNKRQRRGDLVRELQPLLHTYNKQAASFMRIKQQDTAAVAQRRNVQMWFKDHINAVQLDEQGYIDHSDDLMTFSQRHKSSMQRLCERIAFVRWLFGRKAKGLPDFERRVRIGSDDTLQWLADSIIICLGLTMLFGPMWWLEWVADEVKRLAIITCFIFVFATGLRAISRAQPFEILAATAGYAAVLMVFMQTQK